MKRSKLISALILTLVLLCGIAIGAGASSTLQEIKAYLNSDITITMDGEAQTFLDAKGARVYPITYNGSTYLPVRAVAGLVGLDVEWDQLTQTVKLGRLKGVDLINELKPYNNQHSTCVQTIEGKTKDISGNTHTHWISLNGWNGRTCSASYNLEGRYSTLTFQYYSDMDFTLQVLGDNEYVLAEIPVNARQVAQTITVNLVGTSQLTFKVDRLWDDGGAYIFNAILDAEG